MGPKKGKPLQKQEGIKVQLPTGKGLVSHSSCEKMDGPIQEGSNCTTPCIMVALDKFDSRLIKISKRQPTQIRDSLFRQIENRVCY